MTDDEIAELRTRLAMEVQDYAERPDITTDAFERLDVHRAHGQVTEAEILVFDIPRDLIPALQVAHMGYEDLLDLISPPYFDERTHELIAKARAIVPPIRSYGRDIPFETCSMALQSFQWFAKTFFDISMRDAAAIYGKHEWNNAYLVRYDDDRGNV
jgi:hypothetical protein